MGRLEENRSYYEHCIPILKKLYEAKLYEDCLQYAQKLAYHCWLNFAGLYYSYEIECVLGKIGHKTLPAELNKNNNASNPATKHILHICSEVYYNGGHTKLLYNWISSDSCHKHSILSTRMTKNALEAISKSYKCDKITDIYALKSGALIDKAKDLLEYVTDGYEFIVLHIHPDEVLTNMVLSHPKVTSKVFFVNHAEHTFWLGAQITDLLIQIRESNIDKDKIRRSIDNGFYLPIPIDVPENAPVDCHTDQTIRLLSIGSEFKYNPNHVYNFYEEIFRLVQKHPNIEVYIIGVSSDSPFASLHKHSRLHYLGYLSHGELAKYRESCSIYLEGFPIPSFTALLETAFTMKPFLLHYAPYPVYTLFSENDVIRYPKDIYEWRKMLDRLITDDDYRKQFTKKQYESIMNEFSSENWFLRLQNIYDNASKINRKNLPCKNCHDKFFNTDNEKIVVQISQEKIAHLSFAENLNLNTKIKIWRSSPRSLSILKKIRGPQIFRFFMPRFFYFVKRLFQRSNP